MVKAHSCFSRAVDFVTPNDALALSRKPCCTNTSVLTRIGRARPCSVAVHVGDQSRTRFQRVRIVGLANTNGEKFSAATRRSHTRKDIILHRKRKRNLGLPAPRRKENRVDQPGDRKQRAPPDIRVQIKQHNRIRRRMKNFPHSGPTNQNAIHEQRNPDEKPDRNAAFVMRSHRLIAPNADSTLERATKFALALNRNMAQAP